MAIILNRPLSIFPAKSVCHLTRPTSITPSEPYATLSMKASMPSGVLPSDTTSNWLLSAHRGGDIGDLAVWKLLANYEEAGKLHDGFILTQVSTQAEPRPSGSVRANRVAGKRSLTVAVLIGASCQSPGPPARPSSITHPPAA